jgi:hypothetical protein
MIDEVKDDMENCPADDVVLVYMTLSAFIGLVLFLIYQTIRTVTKSAKEKKTTSMQNKMKDAEFKDLVLELYGEDALTDSLAASNHSGRQRGFHFHRKDLLSNTDHSSQKNGNNHSDQKQAKVKPTVEAMKPTMDPEGSELQV